MECCVTTYHVTAKNTAEKRKFLLRVDKIFRLARSLLFSILRRFYMYFLYFYIGEVFPAGRRPALLVPGVSNRGRTRSGPYFEEESPLANVTAPAGSTILLDCRVAMLHDKVVNII